MIKRNQNGWRIGESHGQAVLTEEKVRAARSEHLPHVPGRGIGALAKKYGVSPAAMRDVLNYSTWKHVL